MKQRRTILLILGVFLMSATTSGATTITYTDFSDLSAFTLNGATASINSGGSGVTGPQGEQTVLRLTNTIGQSGSAFLTDPVSLVDSNGFEASFSTAFEFQITGQEYGGADGIVFVVQTVANNVGGGGGGIGYSGIDKSVGIEFDNWYNSGLDPSASHVGIDLDGNLNSVVRANVSDLDDGQIRWAWVDYDGTNDLLEVRLASTDLRPTDALLSYTVDLAFVLEQEDAYIGFTSGTGGAGADHDIRAWQFTNTFDPIEEIEPVPEPATLLLLGAGLIGLAGTRRRFRR